MTDQTTPTTPVTPIPADQNLDFTLDLPEQTPTTPSSNTSSSVQSTNTLQADDLGSLFDEQTFSSTENTPATQPVDITPHPTSILESVAVSPIVETLPVADLTTSYMPTLETSVTPEQSDVPVQSDDFADNPFLQDSVVPVEGEKVEEEKKSDVVSTSDLLESETPPVTVELVQEQPVAVPQEITDVSPVEQAPISDMSQMFETPSPVKDELPIMETETIPAEPAPVVQEPVPVTEVVSEPQTVPAEAIAVDNPAPTVPTSGTISLDALLQSAPATQMPGDVEVEQSMPATPMPVPAMEVSTTITQPSYTPISTPNAMATGSLKRI